MYRAILSVQDFGFFSEERGDDGKVPDDRTVHPDCINASNPYHECGEFCFRRIANAKDRAQRPESPGIC